MGHPEIDELLEGLQGSARDERAELVGWLLGQGFTVDQIRGTTAPMMLAAARVIDDNHDYVSARDIAESYGVDLELLRRVQRANGLARFDDPDAPVHLRTDSDIAAHMKLFLDAGLDPDDIVAVTRIMAEGLSHAAGVMRSASLAAALAPGGTELEIAQRSQALVSRLAPLLGPWIKDMLFMHLRHELATEAVTASEIAAGSALPGAREVAVAFADLVGFTALGEEVPPEELERLANRLAGRARDVAAPPVQFVKTIGDAVMFVCAEPAPLLDAVLELVDTTDSDPDFPRLRAGLAAGPAVSRAGDWFGNPVNLASRVTGVARAGSVLVAERLYETLAETDGFSWSFAGARHLKGIKEDVKLFRVRRDGIA
ncbi:MAG TPA: adenylate/guanylate cyclase domain-containing protein [Mycobacterium sp.]|nr:adenylate/guanylate cyclase domain-containing protein [Mycobacterium sp.]